MRQAKRLAAFSCKKTASLQTATPFSQKVGSVVKALYLRLQGHSRNKRDLLGALRLPDEMGNI